MNINDVRKQFPQYGDMSDQALASALHKKYYSDIPYNEFAGKIGLSTQKETQPRGRAVEMAASAMFGRGMTAGVSDYVAAAGTYTGDRLAKGLQALGVPMGDFEPMSYEQAVQGIRKGVSEYRDQSPVAAYGSEIAGGLASPLLRGTANLIDKGFGAVGRMSPKAAEFLTNGAGRFIRYGTQGAIPGAMFGAGNAQNEQGGVPTASDVGRATGGGAAGGAALGVAVPAVAEGATWIMGRVANALKNNPQAMTAAQIKTASRAAYKAAEDAGVVVSQSAVDDFANALPSQLKGYNARVTPGARSIIRAIKDQAKDGPATLEKLEQMRSVASGASISNNPNESRLAGEIVNKLDDFIEKLDGNQLVGSTGVGGARTARDALSEARSLWKASAKLKTISDIVKTGENLGDANYLKNQFRVIVRNPKKFNRFTKEEQNLIKSIARTGSLDALAKLAPSLDTIGVIKGLLYGGAAMSSPATLALPAAGLAAKPLAAASRASNLQALQDLIARRGASVPNPFALSPNVSQALATGSVPSVSPFASPFITGASNTRP